jgi:hypothetical protein
LVDEIGAIEQLDEKIAVSEVIKNEESWGGVELLVRECSLTTATHLWNAAESLIVSCKLVILLKNG